MNNNTDKKKEQRQNLYVTVTVILMMVAVIVAIAVSLAKTGREIENMKYKEETTALSEKSPEGAIKDTQRDTESDSSIETEDVFFNEKEDENTESGEESDDKNQQSIKQEDTEKESPDSETDSAAAIPEFTVPVKGEILKGASFDVPVFSRTMEDYRTHTGVDIYCEAGTDVASVAAGTIKEIWEDPMMGTCISIEHTGGMMSVYKNLCSDIPEKMRAGRQVNCGEIIATSGDTALLEVAEESHLHFELYLEGEAVDPCQYIEFPTEPVMAEIE